MRVFCTEYDGPDGTYGDSVAALDWEHAQSIVDRRNRQERVIGELFAVLPATEADPTDMIRLLEERDASTLH